MKFVFFWHDLWCWIGKYPNWGKFSETDHCNRFIFTSNVVEQNQNRGTKRQRECLLRQTISFSIYEIMEWEISLHSIWENFQSRKLNLCIFHIITRIIKWKLRADTHIFSLFCQWISNNLRMCLIWITKRFVWQKRKKNENKRSHLFGR